MGLQHNRVVVVTGASRGAGRGIALALGATGATVYVTGRTRREGEAPLPGTVQATADAVSAAGGRGIAVYCDHADDSQVEALFQQVREEQGRLDILVNNATVVHDALTAPGPFWEAGAVMRRDVLEGIANTAFHPIELELWQRLRAEGALAGTGISMSVSIAVCPAVSGSSMPVAKAPAAETTTRVSPRSSPAVT